jgi:hypothetical protein
MAALIFGDLCRKLASEPDEALVGAVEELVSLLEGQVEADRARAEVEVRELLQGAHFGWEDIDRFWNLVLPFSNTELDPNSKHNAEYGHRLLGAIRTLFVGIIGRTCGRFCGFLDFDWNTKVLVNEVPR